MSSLNRYEKDVDEQLDYSINYATKVLQPGETIVESEWIVLPDDDGLVVVTDLHDDGGTTIWLNGGTIGALYIVVNRITTDSTPPRIHERYIEIRITQQQAAA